MPNCADERRERDRYREVPDTDNSADSAKEIDSRRDKRMRFAGVG
jgi:hypothetical protein